ncbi:MAG: PBSX family phage terminase large subunit [Lachnospiraceae bacterium]|nr:PBSX family phage terminase large subunit [Lachnospiraceae bacterium]
MTKVISHDYYMNKNIQPTFYAVILSRAVFKFLGGGRYSMKSKTIVQLLLIGFIDAISQGKVSNVVCVRERQNSARQSCYSEIYWAIELMGLKSQFKFVPSALKIVHIKTGSTFYFKGLNDIEAIKSFAPDNGGLITGVWFEEASEMQGWRDGYLAASGESIGLWNVIDTLKRHHGNWRPVRFYFSYNPASSPNHWLNLLEIEEKDNPRYLFHMSTYKDDELGLLSKDILVDIAAVKRRSELEYRHMYLGEKVEREEAIIKDLQICDKPLSGEYQIFMGVDTAYKGADDICVCILAYQDGLYYIVDVFEVNRGKWIDGETGDEICELLYERFIKPYGVLNIHVDVTHEGGYIEQGLHKQRLKHGGFNVRGVHFQGGTNKILAERKHRPSIMGANRRAEMHLRLQDLSYYGKIFATTHAEEKLRSQIRAIIFQDVGKGKIGMEDKKIIKKRLGKSPDQLDSLVLAIDAKCVYDTMASTDTMKFLMEVQSA